MAAVPGGAPYAGAHSEVVPHPTIGHDVPGPVLAHAAAAVTGYLPILAAVDVVRLIAATPDHGPWSTVGEFRLGVPRGGQSTA